MKMFNFNSRYVIQENWIVKWVFIKYEACESAAVTTDGVKQNGVELLQTAVNKKSQ